MLFQYPSPPSRGKTGHPQLAIITILLFVAFNHNELLWPLVTKDLYLAFKMLWDIATKNCNVL